MVNIGHVNNNGNQAIIMEEYIEQREKQMNMVR